MDRHERSQVISYSKVEQSDGLVSARTEIPVGIDFMAGPADAVMQALCADRLRTGCSRSGVYGHLQLPAQGRKRAVRWGQTRELHDRADKQSHRICFGLLFVAWSTGNSAWDRQERLFYEAHTAAPFLNDDAFHLVDSIPAGPTRPLRPVIVEHRFEPVQAALNTTFRMLDVLVCRAYQNAAVNGPDAVADVLARYPAKTLCRSHIAAEVAFHYPYMGNSTFRDSVSRNATHKARQPLRNSEGARIVKPRDGHFVYTKDASAVDGGNPQALCCACDGLFGSRYEPSPITRPALFHEWVANQRARALGTAA